MSRRILLADDSLTIQKVVELTFADTDYEVTAVSSGDELMKRLPEVRPDVVICDVIMPGRDGYDVCQEIKSHPDYLHLPVVLLTGTFEPFDRERALAAGCSEIVTKPFEARKLMEAVERLATAPPTEPFAAPGYEDDADEPGRVTPPPPIMPPEPLDEEVSFADLNEEPAERPGDSASQAAPAAADDDSREEVLTAEEALDFSTSGFLDMEAAGQRRRDDRLEAPAEGLDFEIAEGSDGGEAETTDPFGPGGGRAAGFVSAATGPDAAADENAPDERFFRQSAAATEDVFAEPEPPAEARPASSPEASPFVADDSDRDRTTPINVAEVMRGAAAGAGHEPAVEPPEIETPEVETPEIETPDLGNADTQDFAPKAPSAGHQTAAGLSDDDIERIARRVLELAGERLEAIAWEVIPDMAEIVVRERIREIESEADDRQS